MKNNLKKIREERGISQAELADAVGTSRQYISNIERDVNTPGLDIAFGIAMVLQLPVEYIFPMEELK